MDFRVYEELDFKVHGFDFVGVVGVKGFAPQFKGWGKLSAFYGKWTGNQYELFDLFPMTKALIDKVDFFFDFGS